MFFFGFIYLQLDGFPVQRLLLLQSKCFFPHKLKRIVSPVRRVCRRPEQGIDLGSWSREGILEELDTRKVVRAAAAGLGISSFFQLELY